MGNNESAVSEKRERQEKRERERRETQERHDREYRNLEEQLYRAKREQDAAASLERLALQEKLQKLEDEKKAAEERKLKEPWRKFERGGGWNTEYHERLMTEVQQLTINDGELERARLLIIGPVRAGKSSFINSVATIDKQRVAYVVETGATLKSMSKTFIQYIPRNIIQNCILMDTMGVEEQEEEGFNVEDVINIIEGHVRPSYKFNPRSPITENDSDFIKNPTLADKAHCVVIVMDSTVIDSDSISDESKKKLEVLQKHIRDKAVPAVLLLTKIDELCEEIAKDITTTYNSRAVESVVKKAHELFGIPKINIFPVRNYSEEEVEFDEIMNILLLLALRKMMHIASDRLATNADNQPQPNH